MMKQLIKCLFWKLLKQLFIISLISCFILLGNSFASAWTYTWWTSWLAYQPLWETEYLDSYSFKLHEYWEFESSYNWNTFDILYYPPYWWWNWRQIYWWIDWKLYYYWDYNWWPRYLSQGFIKYFYHTTKDKLFDVNLWPYKVWENNLPADEFYSQSHNFSNIYTMSTNWSINALYSLTFRTFCLEEDNWIDIYCRSCNANDNNWNNVYSCQSELENSLNYTVSDFDSLDSIPFDFWPFAFPWWNWSWNFTPFPTIDYKQCYTLKEILSLRPQYNTWLCYSSTTVFNWSSFESIESESIFDLFPTFEDFNNSMNKFQNYCNRFLSVWDSCSNAFSWEYKQYSLVSKLPNDVKRQDLYNYCDKALNYDLNISSCVASGGFAWLNPRTDLVPDELFYRLFNPENWNIPIISWSVYDYVFSIYSSWSLWDFMSSPESRFKLWDDAFSIFPSKWLKWDKVWFLPTYIVIGFLGILLLYMIRR